jgi:uncharacterized protein
VVETMASDLHCRIHDLIREKPIRNTIRLDKYVSEKTGMPTLLDIMQELDKPGRDPRATIQVFEFDPNVKTIADLREGQVLPGIITNITHFGCFVDIGIKEKGLIHISNLADKYVSDPTEVVSMHQHVQVKVLGIDFERKRIQLSLMQC